MGKALVLKFRLCCLHTRRICGIFVFTLRRLFSSSLSFTVKRIVVFTLQRLFLFSLTFTARRVFTFMIWWILPNRPWHTQSDDSSPSRAGEISRYHSVNSLPECLLLLRSPLTWTMIIMFCERVCLICAGFPFLGGSAFTLLDIHFLRSVLSSFSKGFLVFTIYHSHKLVHTMSLPFFMNGTHLHMVLSTSLSLASCPTVDSQSLPYLALEEEIRVERQH